MIPPAVRFTVLVVPIVATSKPVASRKVIAPATFSVSATLRARRSMVVKSLVALFSVIAAPPALFVFTVNVLPVSATAPCVTAPVAVTVRFPPVTVAAPLKFTAPVLSTITLPPPAWLMPLMVSGAAVLVS